MGRMTGGLSISGSGLLQRVHAASARWIVAALALTAAAWLVALAGLLAIADRVHDDVPVLLAKELPLLSSHPELIFAGESRTEYQVDPVLAAELLGKPQGSVVNIAYDAGEPLAVVAAMRREPDRFRNAHVVISVAPFLFNEGVRAASVYPLDVAARLGVAEQMTTFLPLRIGTLIRFIREAFASRLCSRAVPCGCRSAAGVVPPEGHRTHPIRRPLAGRHRFARALRQLESFRSQGSLRNRRALRHGRAGRKSDGSGAAMGASI